MNRKLNFFSALCGLAAAAGWEYPENQATGSWGADCTDQKFGSPIDLDYTYRNFNFKHLDYVDEENNDMFKFRGYDTGLFSRVLRELKNKGVSKLTVR